MQENGSSVWLNGSFIPWHEAKVSLHAHTLHYGLGVFEGVRYYKTVDGHTAIFRLADHIKRLYSSAHIVGLKIPYPSTEITGGTLELVRRNAFEEGYIRHLVFLDEGVMGIYAEQNPVSVAISTWKWGAYLGEEGKDLGARLMTSTFVRQHVNASMTKAKVCGQYVNSVLAKWEAIKHGFDEALMLDVEGFVAEASGENAFIVREGVLKTPPLMGVLPGITRDSIMTIAKEAGFTIKEERLTRDELYIADEMFLCGTAAEVTPVRELDGRRVGNGEVGKVTRFLSERFHDVVQAKIERYKGWLTLV